MKNWKDIDIFAAFKEGDKDALPVLFLRYYDYLKHYGLRVTPNHIVVEECIQELFVYIFEYADRLGDVRHVKAYLFSSLRRRLIEKLKREHRREYEDIAFANLINIQFSPEDILSQKENQYNKLEALTKALNNLPTRQREAIYLRYYNCLSTQEIAQVMDVANQTILNTLHQALKKIRKDRELSNLFGLTDS